jgi:hypothetical protein
LSDHFRGRSGCVDPILRPLLGLRIESVEALPGRIRDWSSFRKLRSRRECARCGLTLRCPLWRS